MGNSSVTLTWDELPCSDQNGPLVGYVIRYTPDGGTMVEQPLPIGSNQLTALTPCTSYTPMSAEENDAGIGVFSPPLPVITSGTINTLCSYVN